MEMVKLIMSMITAWNHSIHFFTECLESLIGLYSNQTVVVNVNSH